MKKHLEDKKSKPARETSSTSSYKQTTQTTNNEGRSAITVIKKTSIQKRSNFTTGHPPSSPAGSVSQLGALQTDKTSRNLGTGLTRSASLHSRLPNTVLSSTFGTQSQAAGTVGTSGVYGSSSTPIAGTSATTTRYRTAYSSTTFGTYSGRIKPPPSAPVVVPSPTQQIANIFRSPLTRPANIVSTYPNKCSKIGKALIINNTTFHGKLAERLGAEKDSKDLEELLRSFKFEVEAKGNLSSEAMEREVETFSKSDFSHCDISLVVMMSHGTDIKRNGRRVRGGYTEIMGTDAVGLLTDDVIGKFTASDSHRSLQGKPKIFIFQCCRGDDDLVHDAVFSKQRCSDMLIAYSTLPGFLSNRNPATGTWYIQSICKVFKQHYKEHDVAEMLSAVNEEMNSIDSHYAQISTFENRAFKKCYLYPRN